MDLFLSHATKDSALVARVAAQFASLGVRTYLAEFDVRAGENVHAKIEKAIRNCDVAVVLLTQAGNGSAYVQQEIGFAKRSKKLIIPVVTADVAKLGLGMLDGVEYILIDENAPSEAIRTLSTRVAELTESKNRQDVLNNAMIGVALGILIFALLDQ